MDMNDEELELMTDEELMNDEVNGEELVFAAVRGDFQAVRELLAAGADPNAMNNGYTALYVAAGEEHLEVVQELLAAGAVPNAIVDGVTALYIAADRGNLAIVRELLAAGSNPNASPTIICAAAQSGNVLVVRELLAAGADPNIPGVYDTTALLNAAMDGNIPVIRELIAWGADPTLADDRGRMPLDYPMVQRAWQERLAARRGLDEYSTRHNLPSGISDQVFRNLYPR
jgi:ankyrin repeat protein